MILSPIRTLVVGALALTSLALAACQKSAPEAVNATVAAIPQEATTADNSAFIAASDKPMTDAAANSVTPPDKTGAGEPSSYTH
jgi:hypothetical protein